MWILQAAALGLLTLLSAVPLDVQGAQTGPLTLDEAIELAVTQSERVQAADARGLAADARVDRARAFFFPELAAQGTYTRRLQSVEREVGGTRVVVQQQNAFSAGANLRWAIFNAQGIPLYRAAAKERDATKLEARELRRLFAFEAADAFLATLSTDQVEEAARRRVSLAEQQLREARARADAQLASTNDVTRAELELASAQRELTRARGQTQTTRLELAYLLQVPSPRPLAQPEGLLSEASNAASGDRREVDQALERRFDVAARGARVRALEIFADEPLFRLIPILSLNAQYGLTNESGLSGRVGDGFASLNLTWPIFDGGERYAERDERVSLARAEALEARALDRRVPLEVATARVNLANAQAAIEQARVALEAAQKNAEELQVLYRQGLARALEVADANLRLFEAQVAQARERLALGLAFLDLRASLGLDPLGRIP